MTLDERIARYLCACAPAVSGQDGHGQTFFVACQLVNGFGLSENDALHYLTLYNDRCQPPWSERELIHKVRSAMNASHAKPIGHLIGENGTFRREDMQPQRVERPKIEPAQAIEKYLKGFQCGEADLWEASPIRPDDDFTQDGILLVEHLFHTGESINVVTNFTIAETKDKRQKANPSGVGETTERDTLIDRWKLEGMPVSAAGGWMRINPVNGGVSNEHVTAFRFALLEFDRIPISLQLRLLARLPLPISAILTSGGKSVHAWVKIDARSFEEYDEHVLALRDIIGDFGADRANKNPSRLSRLVGVTRKIEAVGDGRQRLIYLNPEPKEEAIL
jgi:hypothetical protein